MNLRRSGFSIMEVLVSMVLLSVILVGLAGLTYATAQQAVTTGSSANRQAVSLELVNRFSTLPFDSLLARHGTTTCDTVPRANERYRRCVRVVVTHRTAAVEVRAAPLQRKAADSSVVRLDRVSPPPPNPLCKDC
jgi:prepilin-type N-terminal cleavage/methylation domain-containing protein